MGRIKEKMNRFWKISLCFLWQGLCLSSICNSEVIYDRQSHNTLAGFSQFLEGPLASRHRAVLEVSDEGLAARPSERGGFTLFKFKDLKSSSFILRVVFQIPPGIRYANSGIYLLYKDPTVPIRSELDDVARAAFDDAIERSVARAQQYGAGPYEADFFAREVQIISGYEANLPADNHGAGAFYGVATVPQGEEKPGSQGLTPYELLVGDTYEMTLESRGHQIKTYLRSIIHQEKPILVSHFINVGREADPIRGGSPIALLLQAFPNNGQDVKSPIFQKITVDEY